MLVHCSTWQLLLENYHRRLSQTQAEISKLKRFCAEHQDLAEINLNISRNRLLRVEIQLAMMNVSVALSAAAFSMFGMNLVSGLENVSAAAASKLSPKYQSSLTPCKSLCC